MFNIMFVETKIIIPLCICNFMFLLHEVSGVCCKWISFEIATYVMPWSYNIPFKYKLKTDFVFLTFCPFSSHLMFQLRKPSWKINIDCNENVIEKKPFFLNINTHEFLLIWKCIISVFFIFYWLSRCSWIGLILVDSRRATIQIFK